MCVKHLLPLLFFCYLKSPHLFRKEKKKVLSRKNPCLNALRGQAQAHVRFTRLAVLVNSQMKQKVDEAATHKRHLKCFPLQFAITESKPLETFLHQRTGTTPWWKSTAVQAGITRPFISNADHVICFSEYTCWNSLLRLNNTAIICLSSLSGFLQWQQVVYIGRDTCTQAPYAIHLGENTKPHSVGLFLSMLYSWPDTTSQKCNLSWDYSLTGSLDYCDASLIFHSAESAASKGNVLNGCFLFF